MTTRVLNGIHCGTVILPILQLLYFTDLAVEGCPSSFLPVGRVCYENSVSFSQTAYVSTRDIQPERLECSCNVTTDGEEIKLTISLIPLPSNVTNCQHAQQNIKLWPSVGIGTGFAECSQIQQSVQYTISSNRSLLLTYKKLHVGVEETGMCLQYTVKLGAGAVLLQCKGDPLPTTTSTTTSTRSSSTILSTTASTSTPPKTPTSPSTPSSTTVFPSTLRKTTTATTTMTSLSLPSSTQAMLPPTAPRTSNALATDITDSPPPDIVSANSAPSTSIVAHTSPPTNTASMTALPTNIATDAISSMSIVPSMQETSSPSHRTSESNASKSIGYRTTHGRMTNTAEYSGLATSGAPATLLSTAKTSTMATTWSSQPATTVREVDSTGLSEDQLAGLTAGIVIGVVIILIVTVYIGTRCRRRQSGRVTRPGTGSDFADTPILAYSNPGFEVAGKEMIEKGRHGNTLGASNEKALPSQNRDSLVPEGLYAIPMKTSKFNNTAAMY